MDRSHSLSLPYLMPSQAQKHVTVNEAIGLLDALVQPVAARADASLPEEPEEGDCILLTATAAEGAAGDIARFIDGVWQFITPQAGWRFHVIEAGQDMVFDGTDWSSDVLPETTDRLGISATPDETNRLCVSAPATLLNHAGAGHQLKLNKNDEGDTASLLFQTGWSGRAEIGLAGEDALSIKSSPDGSTWFTSLHVDPSSGLVTAPEGLVGAMIGANLLFNPGFRVNQRGFAGGTLTADTYGYDRWRAGASGANATRIASGGVALASGTLEQVVDTHVSAGEAVTFSAQVAGAAVTVDCLGQSVVLSPASARVSHTFSGPVSDTSQVLLALSGTGVTLSDIKLERGSAATTFVERPYAEELALCQFYYEQIGPGPESYNPIAIGAAVTATVLSGYIAYRTKRIIPTITVTGDYQCLGLVNDSDDIATIGSFARALSGFELRATSSITLTPGMCGLFRTHNDNTAFIAIDAEHH